MESLLDVQLEAISALERAYEGVEDVIKIIVSVQPEGQQASIESALRQLVRTCINIGSLESTHETLLKDGTKI